MQIFNFCAACTSFHVCAFEIRSKFADTSPFAPGSLSASADREEQSPLQVVNQLPHCCMRRQYTHVGSRNWNSQEVSLPFNMYRSRADLTMLSYKSWMTRVWQAHRDCDYGGTSVLSGNPGTRIQCRHVTIRPCVKSPRFTRLCRITSSPPNVGSGYPRRSLRVKSVEPLVLVDCLLDVGLFW